MTFREDYSRIRKDYSVENMAVVRLWLSVSSKTIPPKSPSHENAAAASTMTLSLQMFWFLSMRKPYEYPEEFPDGFSGFLQYDGLRQYNRVIQAIRVGCWTHVRRYFKDAIDAQADKRDLATLAGQGLSLIHISEPTRR